MSRLKRSAVKEAFDNLPSGVCFFNQNGMVVLCNHQMHRLVFAMTGKDLQSLPEFQDFLEGLRGQENRKGDVFLLKDQTAWSFSQEEIITNDGGIYIQVTASNVTELYIKQKELEEDNKRLEEYAERMRRLSANIFSLIREEEILNMKMRVHDDIGRSVIATRRFLQQNRPLSELDLSVWKNAVRLLKHENEMTEEKDSLVRLMAEAKGIGIRISINGDFPEKKEIGELFMTAIRECMTNAVRHAGARELYVKLFRIQDVEMAVITNNGAVPEGEIAEGGGLSSLRVRIQKKGGRMKIRKTPGFELTVSISEKWEGQE